MRNMRILIQDYIQLLNKKINAELDREYSSEVLDMLIKTSRQRLVDNGIDEKTINMIEKAVSTGMDLESILERYPDEQQESTK